MLDYLKNLFAEAMPYARARHIAESGDEKARLSLAKNTKTHKEILYYLAEHDPSEKVRQAVAKNNATPLHIAPVQAVDPDVDVRLALAARLVKLLPDLSQDKHSQLYAFTVQALGSLALDEVLKVRKALSETLKDHAHCPPTVAAQLAKDLEREVAEPILRFCVALSDEDLLEIVHQHPASWAVESIATRRKVPPLISQAIVEKNNPPADTLLLKNPGAEMTADTLEKIVERAREFPEWHQPLATHKMLSKRAALYLAGFVDKAIQSLLSARQDFDAETTKEVAQVVRRRVEFEQDWKAGGDVSPSERAARLYKAGKLDEHVISDALAMREHDFIKESLAVMGGIPRALFDQTIELKAPKPFIALCWKAGIGMRLCLRLQQEVARIPHKDLLYPKGGTDYPMTDEELNWQLDFLGVKK